MTFVFDMVENILGNAENGHEKKKGGGALMHLYQASHHRLLDSQIN